MRSRSLVHAAVGRPPDAGPLPADARSYPGTRSARGLVLGRPGGPDLAVEDHVLYDRAAVQVVREEQGLGDMPIVTNVDFGHTDPMWTVPEGIRMRLDPGADALVFLEPGVN